MEGLLYLKRVFFFACCKFTQAQYIIFGGAYCTSYVYLAIKVMVLEVIVTHT